MKYFFWIAFAVFLAASIPHVAYFFASFEPSLGPEGVWWWVVSYAIAISIDVTVYLLSWTAFQRYRKYRSARAVWQHWLLIILCTIFSWIVNWAYAKQFHNTGMLSAAEVDAPWLTDIFPFMASAFPLLGIVYTMMAETITETATENCTIHESPQPLLTELASPPQLSSNKPQRALMRGKQPKTDTQNLKASADREKEQVERADLLEENPVSITAEILAVEENTPESSKTSRTTPIEQIHIPSTEGNGNTLQLALEALRENPDISDEALAKRLALKRAASARFWRLKAKEVGSPTEKTHQGEPETSENAWATAGAGVNGRVAKG